VEPHNGIRLGLAGRRTTVTGLRPADTDMMAGMDVEENDPADVVRAALDGDAVSVGLEKALFTDPSVLCPQVIPTA